MPRYTFLPWARPELKNLPEETLASALPAVVRATVELTLNENAPIGGELLLDGPGEVIGINARQIVRMDPAPGTPNFESNYFPGVEFARPDFPWLFTPATANAQDQLRPWIVLAVVRKQAGVSLLRPERQLPVLEIKSPAVAADELPDLAQSWAWAHAQIEDGMQAGETLETLFANQPHRVGSRLLYPRALKQDAGYFACLVPAFEIGRLAGLGLATEGVTTLEPAWKPDARSVSLPVYHVWEFATGAKGDFESLIQLLLEPKSGGAPVAPPRLVDPSDAGEGLPVSRRAVDFALECPLVPLGTKRSWPEAFATRVAAALQKALAQSRRGDPRVTAPVYGGSYAPKQPALMSDDAPQWLRELNLDPRFRLAASFGAEVIRRNQDRLVDAAWDQAGDIRAANTLIRNAQAAAAAAASVYRRHFIPLTDSAFLEITRPLHARVAGDGGGTFRAMLAQAHAPTVLATAEFRRAARPRGPVFRRAAPVAERSARPFLHGIAAERLTLHFVRQPPTIATPDSVEGHYRATGNARPAGAPAVAYSRLQSAVAEGVAPQPSFAIVPPSLPQPPGAFPFLHAFATFHAGGATGDSETARRFRDALKAHLPRIAAPVPQLFATATAFVLADARKTLAASITPRMQFVASVQSMVTIPAHPAAPAAPAAAPTDTLATVRTSPSFPEPLYAALGAISPDLVVQGFERIGNNTITPLETNAHFVEAFLAGANHEMNRELFWREFPVDERATIFQTFWDSRASVPAAPPDIPPIAAWPADQPLGTNTSSAARAVFLIRGDLIRRYPTAIVYLVQSGPADAAGRPTLGTTELHPVIRGSVASDAAFYGFDVAPEQVVGDPGWIFVVQEPPSEPRFGIEVSDDPATVTPVGDAAKTAKKFLQRPVRFAIHARDLLPVHV